MTVSWFICVLLSFSLCERLGMTVMVIFSDFRFECRSNVDFQWRSYAPINT